MGRINYCDVCHPSKDFQSQADFLKAGKVTVSKYRSSIKDRMTGGRVALDLCHEHRDFLKDCKTAEEAQAKVSKLLWGFEDKVSNAVETATKGKEKK